MIYIPSKFHIFSSDGSHYGCSSKNSGIDLDSARDCFGRLRVMPNKSLLQKVEATIVRSLVPDLDRYCLEMKINFLC